MVVIKNNRQGGTRGHCGKGKLSLVMEKGRKVDEEGEIKKRQDCGGS